MADYSESIFGYVQNVNWGDSEEGIGVWFSNAYFGTHYLEVGSSCEALSLPAFPSGTSEVENTIVTAINKLNDFDGVLFDQREDNFFRPTGLLYSVAGVGFHNRSVGQTPIPGSDERLFDTVITIPESAPQEVWFSICITSGATVRFYEFKDYRKLTHTIVGPAFFNIRNPGGGLDIGDLIARQQCASDGITQGGTDSVGVPFLAELEAIDLPLSWGSFTVNEDLWDGSMTRVSGGFSSPGVAFVFDPPHEGIEVASMLQVNQFTYKTPDLPPAQFLNVKDYSLKGFSDSGDFEYFQQNLTPYAHPAIGILGLVPDGRPGTLIEVQVYVHVTETFPTPGEVRSSFFVQTNIYELLNGDKLAYWSVLIGSTFPFSPDQPYLDAGEIISFDPIYYGF